MSEKQKYIDVAKKVDGDLTFWKSEKEYYDSAVREAVSQWCTEVTEEVIEGYKQDGKIMTWSMYIKTYFWTKVAYYQNEEMLLLSEEELAIVVQLLCAFEDADNCFVDVVEHLEKAEENVSEDGIDTDNEEKTIMPTKEEVLESIEQNPDYILSETVLNRILTEDENFEVSASTLYSYIMDCAGSFGFKKWDPQLKSQIFEAAVKLREYPVDKYDGRIRKIRDDMYPCMGAFPIMLDEVLLYFFQWSYDEKNTKKVLQLFNIIQDYLCDNLIAIENSYEDLQIGEMNRSALEGQDIQPYLLDGLEFHLGNFGKEETISKLGLCLYEYPDLYIRQFEPWGDKRRDTMTATNVLDATRTIVSEAVDFYHQYQSELAVYAEKIENWEEHIENEDCPTLDYSGEDDAFLAENSYGILSMQRDFACLDNGNGYYWITEEEREQIKGRLKKFLDYREEKIHTIYIKRISTILRKCLYVFQMMRGMIERLLVNEHELVCAEAEAWEELYNEVDTFCSEVERRAYRRFDAVVREGMTSISYEGVKQMQQLEEEINASIRDYREELKKVWEKESLEELLEKKQEKFAELRRRIPCLSVDNLEETVTLYRSFLERKTEDRLLMAEVEAKYSSVWDIAQEKVVKLYGTKNRQYRPESKEVFLKTLFTGEYLYQKFCEENSLALLDYSGIALEYYAAMEYFMNVYLYRPLKVLYLSGNEENYESYMSSKTYSNLTHNKYVNNTRRTEYNNECMMGAFGYLFKNIHNAPGLFAYIKQLRSYACNQVLRDDELEANIVNLGKRIIELRNNISERRNASAHGGNVLLRNEAMAARQIVYNSDDSDTIVPELKGSFQLLLKILGI